MAEPQTPDLPENQLAPFHMFRFQVSFTGYAGPSLTVFGPGFQREFVGYFPATHVDLEVAAGQSVPFHWLAEAGGTCHGIDVRSYRWVLDPEDLSDETPRTDEATDLKHWSAPSLATTSATVGPFAAGPDLHHFFVEVTDIVGVKSLGADSPRKS